MGDQHKGATSLDARFIRILDPLRRRLAPITLITTAFLAGAWYATNWRDVYMTTTLNIKTSTQADVVMGLVGTLLYASGIAATLLVTKFNDLMNRLRT